MEEGLKHKGAANFRKALKLYETKLFPKALKTIEKVIVESPRHGEALALKALILSYLNRLEEALGLAKEAILCNLKSGMCWHTLGLLQKATRNLEEALKCFMQAANFDPNNHTILRDLSMLQVHLKDYNGYKASRLKLLVENPNLPTNWVSYAVAEHLSGNRSKALEVLDSFWKSASTKLKSFEKSELLLYKAQIMQEQGLFAQTLQFLQDNQSDIVDKVGFNDAVSALGIKTGNLELAKQSVYKVLDDNFEDQGLLLRLAVAHGCDSDESRLELYSQLSERYPASRAIQRLPLNYASGDRFQSLFNTYIKARIKKGIPSLANDIKGLYQDASKRELMGAVIERHLRALRDHKHFDDEEEVESPSSYLWTLVLYSRHTYRTGDIPGAFRLIEESITHTPTIPDLYLLKAKLLKKQSLFEEAAKVVNEARCLDFHDRFLNNKAAKYFFRVNKVEEGQEIMSAFSKETGEEPLNCHDNQSMWYELEVGAAYFRRGELGKAGNEFDWVQRNLEEIYEGQYDYHAYCMRKTTLRSYFRFLAFEDTVFASPAYAKAVSGFIRCHLADPASIPLEKVLKATKKVLKVNSGNKDLDALAYELYKRQGKYLLALKLLKKLQIAGFERYPESKAELISAVERDAVSGVVLQSFNTAIRDLP